MVNTLAHGVERCTWRAAVRSALPAGTRLVVRRVAGFDAVQRAAQDAVCDGADLVVAVGGDGTANACVNGIGSSRVTLAVIPAGTANDLARIVGQPRDRAAAVADISSWRANKMDAVTVNGTRFLSVGGLGFAADAAALANTWRTGQCVRTRVVRMLGSAIYTLAAAWVILLRRRLGARLALEYVDARDGRARRRTLDGYGILVANAGQLGKDLHLTDTSRTDDGVVELLLFPRMGRLRLLRCLFRARRRRLLCESRVELVPVKWARVVADSKMRFFGDGEVLDEGTDFVIGVEPGKVRIMGPPTSPATRVAAPGLDLPQVCRP